MEKMRKLLICALMVFLQNVSAAEVYKWTDEQGKVHFGDQKAKPNTEKGERVIINEETPQHIISKDNNEPQNKTIEATEKKPQVSSALPPFEEKSWVYVGFVNILPQCKEIAERIALLPSGTPFQSLAFEFGAQCPKVTYECVWYKRHPERNKCYWIKQQNKTIVSTKVYE